MSDPHRCCGPSATETSRGETLNGRGTERWHVISPGDPDGEREMWLELDASEEAEQLLLDHGHLRAPRKKFMRERKEETTADCLAQDRHIQHDAAIARRSNEGGAR